MNISRYKLIFKRFFTYPLHLGGFDNNYFPDLNYNRINEVNLPFSTKNKLKPSTRVNFWLEISKYHYFFKYFFYENPIVKFRASSLYKKLSNNQKNNIRYYEDLIEKGYVEINNFLDNKEYLKLKKSFEDVLENNIDQNKSGSYGDFIPDSSLNSIIYKKIKLFEKTLLGVTKKQKYKLSVHYIRDNIPPYATSVEYHMDTFVPCIKMFYFLEEVKTNPLQFLVYSHKINNQFKSNALLSAKFNHENILDKFDTNNYEEKTFNVDANTLVIAFTHGFHKRKPENINGSRKFITISYYDVITRYHLIYFYLKGRISNLFKS